MDRLFLDANVLYSAAYISGASFRQLWELPDVVLISSAHAVDEAWRNLAEDRPERLGDLEELLSAVEIHFADTHVELPEIGELPEKDQPILTAAVGAGATHLITGDKKHFARYYGTEIGGVLILPPALYLKARSS